MSVLFALAALALPAAAHAETTPAAPRIVNLYNFCRNTDYRLRDSENVLFDATTRQIELIKKSGLPATWALQYDALMNPRYHKLFKEQLRPEDEIAGWWEIPQPLAEKAGLKWRGAHEWDSAANVGFSPGYTPAERVKLVDVYMADFKAVFGYYPKTMGSWYIDEITLAYMAEKYGVIASCDCKDQVGTDGYTLWGGYWNQAYYPSKLNAYMPAQTKAAQIDIPIFRMLGSDPIDQYGRGTGDMNTLEPVYPRAGGSAEWVNVFMDNLIQQPCLAFGYAQAGQENSFGWPDMKTGLTMQIELLAKQAKAGEIRVETLAASGKWFREKFPVTPATAVVALEDWQKKDRKAVWYDSRFYRCNLLWQDDTLFVRDLHQFDETLKSANHDSALAQTFLTCGTLPMMDGSLWSADGHAAGIRPVLLAPDAHAAPLATKGTPVVTERLPDGLEISQALGDGGTLTIVFTEKSIRFVAVDSKGGAFHWALESTGGAGQQKAVQSVTPTAIHYRTGETNYQLKTTAGTCARMANGTLRLTADETGKIEWVLDATSH